MVSRWSSAFTRKSLEDVLICLQVWSQRRLRLVWNGSRDDLFSRRCKDVFQKAFSRPPEDVLKRLWDVLKTSPRRCLDEVLKNGRLNLHFRPIKDVLGNKIKTFLRRLYDVFVSAGNVFLWMVLPWSKN